MSSKASTVVIRTIFTVMLTAMFAGCGGGSTGNSALIGSASTAENSRGSPSLPSTISPATEMPEDIITANGTAKLVLREDFQANSPSSPNILSLQGATLISSAGVDAMHSSAPYQLTPNEWNMVTASWQSGQNGYCKLFINGEKIAEYEGPFTADYYPSGPLHLGSELGANDPRNRTTNADFAALRLYDGPLLDTAVYDLFLQSAPTFSVSTVVPARLQSRYELPYTPRRDANGILLESRVIFDEDMHWANSAAEADAILQRIKDAGYNVYVPCIYHGGGSWHPTPQLAPPW